MINFFIKRSKIVVDAFTANSDIFRMFPLMEAKDNPPSFYKNLQPESDKRNMKYCAGLIDYYKSGFLIPNVVDIELRSNNREMLVNDSVKLFVESHPSHQHGNYFKNHHHVKFNGSWYLREKTEVKFLMTNLFWHDYNFLPFVVNGVLDFKYQHGLNINTFMPKGTYDYFIPAGKPLAQLIPLTEKEVVIKNHHISRGELLSNFDTFSFTKTAMYQKKKKFMQKNEKKGRCPFTGRKI